MVSSVVEGNTSTHEYLYDVNGNMKEDKNKGITVVYNYLNLPIQVKFGPNNRIDWTYTATGAKLQKKVYTNGSLTLTQDYVSGFVYKNGSLDFFSTETGRVKNQSGTLKYQYTLTDHLGNTRVMFADTNNNGTPEMIEESHYYAFGMRIEGLSTTNPDNKFTYNGKELEDDHGLNWYHYGARFYDAQIGRWHVVDIVDEFFSPYLFVGNNPIAFKDPNGMWDNAVVAGARTLLGKKYGDVREEFSWLSIRTSDGIHKVETVGINNNKTIEQWWNARQMVCNQFVYAAFRRAGYDDFDTRRGNMKDWFKDNGSVFGENEIDWQTLQPGDVVNFGSYESMNGHVYMVASSIVTQNGTEGYMIIHSAWGKGSVEEFKTIEQLKSWGDLYRNAKDFEMWLGRVQDPSTWHEEEQLLED
jgi:RHS repeat-associated protein